MPRVNATWVWAVGSALLLSAADPSPAVTQTIRGPISPLASPAQDAQGDPLPPGAVARLGTTRLNHGRNITDAAFSPNGKLLATAGEPGDICLWDVASEKLLRRWGYASHVAMSPDGKLLAASCQNCPVVVWDLASGKELYKVAGIGQFGRVVFSPDSAILAAGGGNVRLHDAATGKLLRITGAHDRGVHWAAFSRDGKQLASSGSDYTIRIWDTATGKELHRLTLPPQEARPFLELPKYPSMAFAPEGTKMLLWGPGLPLQLWNVASGKVERVLGDKEPTMWDRVIFSTDGALMAWMNQGTTQLWDTRTWKPVRKWEAGSFTFSPDGKTLVSSGCRLRFWDVSTGKELRAVGGHRYSVEVLSYAADGRRLISGSRDQTVRQWDWRSGREEKVWQVGLHHWMSFSHQGHKAVVGWHRENKLRIWDFQTNQSRVLDPAPAIGGRAVFSPNGQLVAWVGHHQDTIHLFDLAKGREVFQLARDRTNWRSIAFSHDGATLISVDPQEERTNSLIRIFDVKTGKEKKSFLAPGGIIDLTISPDGRYWATAAYNMGQGDEIRLWDAVTLRELAFVGGTAVCKSVRFSPDGRLLALKGYYPDGVRLVEVATGQQVRRIEGQRTGTESLAFAPDHQTLATGGANSTILVWDLTGRMQEGRLVPRTWKPKELEQFWSDLGHAEAGRALDAVWALAGSPRQAAPFIGAKLKPASAVDPIRLKRLIRDLGSDRFVERIAATRELEKMAEAIEGPLREALAARPTLELSRRLEQVLGKLVKLPVVRAETLRGLRAVQALEYMATKEARYVLRNLAGGADGARLTQEARLTLARLVQTKS